MNLSSETMLKLMAYADDELDGDERREVEALLASSAAASRFVADIGNLGSFVTEAHEHAHADAFASFDVADAVMAKIAADPSFDATFAEGTDAAEAPIAVTSVTAGERVKLSSVAPSKNEAAADGVAPPAAAAAKAPSSLDAARERRASRLRVGGGIVAALALAAAVFFVARPKEEPMALSPVNPASEVASSGGGGVEVTAVESPGQSVSVFYLPSANEVSTSVVVWVDESGEK